MKILDIKRGEQPYYPNMDGRAIGNTFRRIMNSFYQASEGNHVYYVVNDGRMCEWTYRKFADVAWTYFGELTTRASKKHRIEFPDGGFIQVVSKAHWGRNPTPPTSGMGRTFDVIEMDDTH